jgi:hypothetical protein
VKKFFIFITIFVIAAAVALVGCEKKQQAPQPAAQQPAVTPPAPAPEPPAAPAPMPAPAPAKPAKK